MSTQRSRCGAFTIAELIIVMMIIVLLVAILLPALGAARARAKKVASQAQLTSLGSAIESYTLALGSVPGYAKESDFSSSTHWKKMSSNENLVISLLGRVVPSGATTPMAPAPGVPMIPAGNVDVDLVGTGPRTTGGATYGAFYSPKPEELAAVNHAAHNPNNMPELVDASSGMPILYYRANGNSSTPVAFWGTDPARVASAANATYMHADEVITADGTSYAPKTNSMLSYFGAGSDFTTLNRNLAWYVTRESTSNWGNGPNSGGDDVVGSFALIGPGPDGIAANIEHNGGSNSLANTTAWEDFLSASDDSSYIGG